jgi:hypothetical protein
MPNTPVLGLPYPLSSDTADVPRDMQALAVKLDTVIPGQLQVATVSGQVLDVGLSGQIRAGRQLAVSDFTSLGLAQPRGLWNLSNLTNLGSDGRALVNKGGVPFGAGINGVNASAAVFAGSTAQALYIADSGAADPFRISTGSWGCWFRTAKRGANQGLVARVHSSVAANNCYNLYISTGNAMVVEVTGAVGVAATGVSDVCDDRWHFVVGTHDGTAVRLYVDGILEATATAAFALNSGASPLNIGAAGADSGAAASLSHYGRVDEAFVSGDVLTEDQIRSLYAAKLTHTLGVVPTGVRLNVRRNRKGAALATTDFSTTPLRLHNFTAGALTDQGSGNVALTNNGAVSVAGGDGAPGGAFSFAGAQSLSATDAGLPAALTPRSYGCWFKTTALGANAMVGWGTLVAAHTLLYAGSGNLASDSGGDTVSAGFVADGQWHFAVVIEDNAAGDGVRRKLYLDGRLVGGSTVMNATTLAGANKFRIGANPNGASPFTGQIDGVFVTGYAMTTDEVLRLYAKGSQALAPSPKNAGDHVEALQSDGVLFIGDTLESQHTVDLGVTA